MQKQTYREGNRYDSEGERERNRGENIERNEGQMPVRFEESERKSVKSMTRKRIKKRMEYR